ncbi:uncharacterized protein LOC142164251 [Nicotiana tabacum]|uniref:Uncharacterized protein LOC142164251 n=1 Tax=Nicotiana tabacum TaxID=4097 RepID=A0AC58RYZ9_TOBAC
MGIGIAMADLEIFKLMVLDEDASYSMVISTIAEQLMIDTSEKIVEIKYIVNEKSPQWRLGTIWGFVCSSGTIKLLDMPASPVIEEYQSEIITEGTQSVIEEGQVYQDKQTIATAMKHYSIMHKYQFRVKRSSHRSYWLICVGENCNWHFKETSINDFAMFKVRSFNRQHTCTLMDNTFIHRKRTAVVVGSMIIPKYCDPRTVYTPTDIQTDMLSQHGVNLSYMQAWRAKEKTLQFLRGHPADSYSKLPKYFYILEKMYPGSVVKLKKTADECFLYAFVALCTSIRGWEYCRPVVVVDGTFLKSTYRGIMLTTSTMDVAVNYFLTNNVGTILPLAYAVVDSENDASWKWFFEQFKQAYGERTSMCVVSDRNESILKATSIVYPGVPHYSCMWHIWANIKAKFKKCHLQLNELWSRVHATMNRIWTMISNIAEPLNVVTKDARELPIFDLLEYMRTLLERWTNEKLLKAKGTFTFLGSKFNKELENNRTLSQKLRVGVSTDHIHTVIDGVKRYVVCLESKKCSCGQFQLDELPCTHDLAALRHKNETYENYCSTYYTKESLLRTYEIPVNPLPDESK